MSSVGIEAGNVAVLLSYPLVSVWRGYVLTVLWSWFIVPFGIVEVGLIPAMGIFLIASLVRFDVSPYKNYSNKDYWEVFSQTIVLPAFILGVGYVIHLFL